MKEESFAHRYGPWALVAGASQGLGAEFADQLAARGLNLVLIARSADKLTTLATQIHQQHSVEVRTLAIDLSSPDAAGQAAAETRDLDTGLLVYNAALSTVGQFFEVPLEDHLRQVETNIRTPLAFTYHFGRAMTQRGRGGIIWMSSLSSIQGSALISNYAATKAYGRILAEGLWEELRGQGIDVLSCWASSIDTPNYRSSLRRGATHEPVVAMPPQEVARETLQALGRQPVIIPGFSNRLATFFLTRLMPRQAAIRLMGRILRKMYA